MKFRIEIGRTRDRSVPAVLSLRYGNQKSTIRALVQHIGDLETRPIPVRGPEILDPDRRCLKGQKETKNCRNALKWK